MGVTDPQSDSQTKEFMRESYPRSDVERKGSMGRRWGASNGVYPEQQQHDPSFQPAAFPPPPVERHRISLLVPFFVIVNVVMFILTMYFNNCPKNAGQCVATFLGRFSFQPLSENPLLGPSSITLRKLGALDTSKVIYDHQGWRLITCIWLHAGVVHILANMLSLLFIGIRLEQEFGFLKIGIIYLLSGFGGSLLSALFLQNQISVGASGALFGLLGAMLSELLTNWTIYANKCAALTTLVLVVALNLAVGILPHVDNFAHIGGFISGFLLGFVLLVRPQFGWISGANLPPSQRKPKHMLYQHVFLVLALVILVVGFTTVVVLVFRGVDGNKTCKWCHYLSCVPTSRWKCDSSSASCTESQMGNMIQLTCSSNNKTSSVPLTNSASLSELCTQLCT